MDGWSRTCRWTDGRVVVSVRVRRLVCPVLGCSRQTFREQVPGIVERYQRRTNRLTSQLGSVVQELAGRAGARLSRVPACGISRSIALAHAHVPGGGTAARWRRTSSLVREAGGVPPGRGTATCIVIVPARARHRRLRTQTQALPHLHSFANGLELDRAAVDAGLTRPYHNGRTEGVNTRIKRIMRQLPRKHRTYKRVRIMHAQSRQL